VAEPWSFHAKNFFDISEKIQMFEPHPDFFKMLEKEFKDISNLKIHNLAIGDKNEMVGFCFHACSLKDNPYNPASKNNNWAEDKDIIIEVQSSTIDKFDDGTIDLLTVDTEGSEWFTLKYLISRPKILCIETHGGNYVNPYLNDITKWMGDNEYIAYAYDLSDTVFIKK
jgi:FkbM family methyltransferase